ncbi:hypothetical protein [Clostridium sp. Ade.TY]|uniref:hypothetical protein n=1 Tax=Clostridium sp. Ade.TY TaxID=1391647 RepID=UPI0003FEA163|nr:hypothetical protein [Clostridium sp. Ade.TY]
MKDNYNSFSFWGKNVNDCNAVRGHAFTHEMPNSKSVYIHALIFSDKNGIESLYSYFPNPRVLLGYLQHSFMQKAFYNWANGTKKLIMKVPALPTKELISDLRLKGKITKEEAEKMKQEYDELNYMWDKPEDEILSELIKFGRKFNKVWLGDNSKFLYIKVFKKASDLAEFIKDSVSMTGKSEEFKNTIGISTEDFVEISHKISHDKEASNIFRKIILDKLTEVL